MTRKEKRERRHRNQKYGKVTYGKMAGKVVRLCPPSVTVLTGGGVWITDVLK